MIEVTYNAKTRRLGMKVPFHLVDVARGYPSRRFNPKNKTWDIPLVKANVNHYKETKHLYPYKLDDAATIAMREVEFLTAKPKLIPFPVWAHDFKASKLKFDPYEHQLKMLDLSWGLPASAWFAKMGTGKSYAAIHLMFARWNAKQIDRVVIICPSTLRLTWKKELEKYAPGPYEFRVHETKSSGYDDFCKDMPRDKLQILAVSVEGLGISEKSYDSVCAAYIDRRVMTVCDESSRIKNPDAKRTQRTIMLGGVSAYRVILNGTPIALGIHDLWSQYEFLDPNIIGCGDYWAFKTRYLMYGGYENKEIIGYQNVEELMNAIIPYTVEVGKDVLNLPPKIMQPMYCEATPIQKKLFKLILKGTTGDPNEPIIKCENVLERVLRLRQVVGGYLPEGKRITKMIDGIECETIETTMVPLDENPKLNQMLDIVDMNVQNTKYVIWSSFVHEIEHIRNVLATKYGAHAVECYYGGTAMEDRSRIEDRYCNDPKMRFFIGNPTAAGLGLTLISGENDAMIYYSGTNAYIDRAQSEDRSHRIGQNNNVVVIDLVMERTIDEAILEAIKGKMGVEEYIYARVKQGIKLEDAFMG